MPTFTWWIIIDITLAIGSLWYSQKLFLFLFFCYYLWSSLKNYNSTRALVHVYQVSNEVDMLAVKKKLHIDVADIAESREEYLTALTDNQRAALDKDFDIVGTSS